MTASLRNPRLRAVVRGLAIGVALCLLALWAEAHGCGGAR